MRRKKCSSEQANGFTLLEVMIAMLVFTIGILAVAGLQQHAIQQNGSAFDRTRANAVATAVLEELKQLPFTDSNLSANGNLNAGMAVGSNPPDPSSAGHQFVPSTMPGLAQFQTDATKDLIDGAGKTFTLFWNVEQTNTITVGSVTYVPTCNIRLFIYWNTPLGRKHLEMTAVKFNNTLS